jgi:hypothetical protein
VNTPENRAIPFRRLHDWLLRRRLIRGQQWGQATFAQRLLRIRLRSSVLLALFPLLLCAWYSLTAWAAHLSHEAEITAKEPLTWRLFQLHLHDKLTRDFRRLMAPEPKHKSVLPTYGLVIGNDKLDQLAARLPPDDGQPYYVDAQLVKGNRDYNVQVRYRGGKYWHYNHPQKSWKVRVKDGKVVEGLNTFNFINTPEAVPFEEQIILDVAREMGLLTPGYFPFRLLLNKAYYGVHFFESQPDEGMLRQAQRPLGTIYSGSESPVDPATGISSLFKSADNFTKVTQGIHQNLGERRELESLVVALNDASPAEFVRYADAHLDVERFARWDALDVVFGCNQHDFSENHKLYFDPYRDRFEPIAWNFRGCKHEPELNRTENPLILRLKQLPEYITVRNRIVYETLRSAASSDALRVRMEQLLQKLREDQARDPYWDAFQLLPAVNPYYSTLLRPVDRRTQDISVETRLFELRERQNYLAALIEKPECNAKLFVAPAPTRAGRGQPPPAAIFPVDVTVAGHAGYALERIEPKWPSDCQAGRWRLYADTSLDGSLQSDQDRGFGMAEGAIDLRSLGVNLYPGAVMQKRTPQVHRGRVRVATEPRTYRFFLESTQCVPASVEIRLKNLVTDSTTELSTNAPDANPPTVSPTSRCRTQFSDEPGYSSPHPWCYQQPERETVVIGPGLIEISTTRAYSRYQRVEVAPGTTVRLAKGVSIIFSGPVTARGSENAPIVFEGNGESWGGIAIQGEGTKGSVFEYVSVRNGTHPTSDSIPWPGVFNVSDTSDILLNHCSIEAKDSVPLQIGESRNVGVSQSAFRGGNPSVQVKFSSARFEGLSVIGSAGDGIVLAESQAEIRSTKVLAFGADGISASRRSDVKLEDVVLARGQRGIRVHEASQLSFERVLLFDNRECIGFTASSDSYSKKTHIGGSELFKVNCQDTGQKDLSDLKAIRAVAVQPGPADLAKLRAEVLGITEWSQLGARLDELAKAGAL